MKTLDQFLKETNGRARTRVFSETHYKNYVAAYEEAVQAATAGRMFYREQNAGGVANCYGNMTTTARWGVCVIVVEGVPFIEDVADRARICGRNVPCVYYGGERAYKAKYRGLLAPAV